MFSISEATTEGEETLLSVLVEGPNKSWLEDDNGTDLFSLFKEPKERRQCSNIKSMCSNGHQMVKNSGNLSEQGYNGSKKTMTM